MSKREDIETLRKYAREDQNGTGWFERNNIAQVVRRLFLCDGDPLIKFAGSDLAGLRRALDDVPMTRRGRENVGCWLDKLQRAMETETPEADDRERHAERAIETLTEYLGEFDGRLHNYGLAAASAKLACEQLQRIWKAIPGKQPKADEEDWKWIADHAIGAFSALVDHARIIEIKERWHKETAEDASASDARRQVVRILNALRCPVARDNAQLSQAFDDISNLLNHLLDDEIPF